MMTRIRTAVIHTACTLSVIVAMYGCANPVARNQPAPDGTDPLESERAVVTRASLSTWTPGKTDKPFIGIAFSGGGSRAAVFGWAVLAELDAAGLLADVEAVSSVSGGSLAAGLFALNGDRIASQDEWQILGKRLRHDFLMDWGKRLANPINIISNAFSGRSRTEMMGEVFDAALFSGATFADLGESGPRRPQLFINATRSTSPTVSQGFVFDNDDFAGRLGSRLDRFRVADAVMASGAFPGVFGNLPIRNFREQVIDPVNSRRLNAPLFEQVYDGGPSDNLGVWTLMRRAQSRYQASVNEGTPMKGCLMILVDAHARNDTRQLKSLSADSDESIVDLVVKPTAWDSIDALLYANRVRTLQALGFRTSDTQGEREDDQFVPISIGEVNEGRLSIYTDWIWSYNPIATMPLFGRYLPWEEPTAWAEIEGGDIDTRGLSDEEIVKIHERRAARTRELEKQAPNCLIWHLSFDRLPSVSDYHFRDGTHFHIKPAASKEVYRSDWVRVKNPTGLGSERSNYWNVIAKDPLQELSARHKTELISANNFRYALFALTGSTDTNYRLTGPKGCSADFIGDGLERAAKVLVNEDRLARDKVCAWYREHGLMPACDADSPSLSPADLPQPWFAATVRTTQRRAIPVFYCRSVPSDSEREDAKSRFTGR